MFRHLLCLSISTATVLNLATSSLAVPIESVPNPRRSYGGWVTDMANILAPETEAELNRQISALEASNRSEMAVVTVPDVAPSKNPKAFATQLFNTWGIGKQGQDNGILLLVSNSDRRVEVVTGRGFSTLLPDTQVSNILRSEVIPKFKQGQFDAGVLAGTQSLISRVSQTSSQQASHNTSTNWIVLPLIFLGMGVLVAKINRYQRDHRLRPTSHSHSSNQGSSFNRRNPSRSSARNQTYDNHYSSHYTSMSDSSSSSSWSSSDSSSSSSDFGGGSSDGGGSGDSW